MDRKAFWMILVEGRGMPQRKHLSFAEAKEEAERLARMTENRGMMVYLLRADLCCSTIEEPPVEWELLSEATPEGDKRCRQ